LSAWTFAYFMTEYEMCKIRAAAVEYMKESYECEKHLEDYDEPTSNTGSTFRRFPRSGV